MKRRTFLKLTTLGSAPVLFPAVGWSKNMASVEAPSLESLFLHPPNGAKPQGFWFWMNGNISKDGITRDIAAMDAAGFGGVLNMNVTDGIPAGPVVYNSDEWHEMIQHALGTLKKHKMVMVSYNCAGWSSGGGPWISPEQSMKQVVWSEQNLQGPHPGYQGTVPQPSAKQGYYNDIALLAFPTPANEISQSIMLLGTNGNTAFRLSDWQAKAGYEHVVTTRPQKDRRDTRPDERIVSGQMIDISRKMDADGSLHWDIPEGNWTIMRMGYTTTGATPKPAPEGGVGLECDKLNRAATTYHWEQLMGRIIKEAGPLTGDTLISVEIDSFEAGAQNWTQNFPQEFEQRRGYSLLPFLPCVSGRVVDSVEKSERFLWDFRRTIADLFVENYYGTFAALCHNQGLQFSNEPYGPTGLLDDFAIAEKADIPMGELWVNRYDAYHFSSSKMAASAAHANGHPVVGAESFTAAFPSSGWKNDPYSLKNLGDLILAKGVNRLIFHNTVHQPWADLVPGMTMGPHGIQMNRGNTWFKQSSAWLSYLSRCSALLQQGRFVGDICYYFGENVSNAFDTRERLHPVPPAGYDYDVLATTFIMQFTVEDGMLVLPSGMQYRLLVLPDFLKTLQPAILQQLYTLVQAGATVVAPKPVASPSLSEYPACDEKVRDLAAVLWGAIDGDAVTENHCGQGRVFYGKPLQEVLTELGIVPDLTFRGKHQPQLTFIHRQVDSGELYFVSNQTQRYSEVECTFRATGRPEFWNAETGMIEAVACYKREAEITTIPMLFEPAESIFVMFKNGKQNSNPIVDARLDAKSILEPHTVGTRMVKLSAARYGFFDHPDQNMDVRQEVQGRIQQGQLDIIPCRHIKSDPAPEAPDAGKTLQLTYQLDDRTYTETINRRTRFVVPMQPGGLTLPSGILHATKSAGIILEAWKAGQYHFTWANGQRRKVSVDRVPEARKIEGAWGVQFPKGWGAPEQLIFERLISWTEHSHFDVQHFSGTATYEKNWHLSQDERNEMQSLYLDLGRVKNIAEVHLNGRSLGILWKPPFRVNITDAVRTGNNRLEIRVTNLLPNRLIGDAGKPDVRAFKAHGQNGFAPDKWNDWLQLIKDQQENGRYNRETGRYTFATWKRYKQNDPLLESGLIGPVQLLTAVRKEVGL